MKTITFTDEELNYIKHCLGFVNIATANTLNENKSEGRREFYAMAGSMAMEEIIKAGEEVNAAVWDKFFSLQLTNEQLEIFKRRFDSL